MSDEEKEGEEKPFAVERAKSGRAKCKKCKCPLEKGNVRIAKIMTNPFGSGTMKCWYHVTCIFDIFAKQRATTKRINNPEEDISGWEQLEHEDKDLILKKLEEFEKNTPFKGAKVPNKSPKEKKPVKPELKTTDSDEKASKKDSASTTLSTRKDKEGKKEDNSEDEKFPSRDDMFREFRRLCYAIADASAYLEKTAIVKKMFTKGSKGGLIAMLQRTEG